MIVCHCHAVSDRTIRDVVRKGAGSARKVALACNAGRMCGGCRPLIARVIDEEANGCPRSDGAASLAEAS